MTRTPTGGLCRMQFQWQYAVAQVPGRPVAAGAEAALASMKEWNMRPYTVLRPLTAIAVLAATLLPSPCVSAEEDAADWWAAQRELSRVLMEENVDIAKLAANLISRTPKNSQEAMFKLCVLMRCGMNEQAIEALRELKTAAPELQSYQASSIYYDACDNTREWEIARATVEIFADNISELALDNRLLKHLLSSGWTVRRVDRWLADRPSGTASFWVKERLRFNVRNGQGDSLVKELCENVRRDPANIDGAIALLEALAHARITGNEEWELSWMAETIRPELATQAEHIASRLKALSRWGMAISFYQRAIDTPLTEDESLRREMMCAAFVPLKRLRAMFAVHAREGMAECLLKLGNEDQAQKWMVEAADIRQEHNLGLNALFAGQTQAASGQRTIEGRIKEEEKKSEDNPQYWQERARYYRGRKEPAQEEEALTKGLALTTPQPEPERRRRGHVDWRSWLLADYAHFLMREKRTGEAVALLRKEIEQAPAISESTQRAAHVLAFDLDKQITAEDPVLWNWLASRPTWQYTEERLLWRMLENAERDSLDEHFIRAEKAARGKDASRAHVLGWIMNRMDFPQRSIPLLEYAADNAHDRELKQRAHFGLFESYLDTGDWKRAEGIFPEAAKELTPKELPEWYSRMAVAAAEDAAKTDAMRIWRRVANLSPSQIDGLEDLAKAGLRNELVDFYLEMQKKMPSSEAPANALAILAKK